MSILNKLKVGTGAPVAVNLFDGHIQNAPGVVIGIGMNSENEPVYLVEMEASETGQSEHPDPHVGTRQLDAGKKWVLSIYPEELEPRTVA